MATLGVAPELEPELRCMPWLRWPPWVGEGGVWGHCGGVSRVAYFLTEPATWESPLLRHPLSLRLFQPVLVLLDVLVVVPAVRYDGPTADHFDLRLRVALQEVGDQFGLRLQGREGLFSRVEHRCW